MKKAELVFIPSPGAGHLVSTVEIAKRLIKRDERLSITVLIIKLPTASHHTNTFQSSDSLKFVELPELESSVPFIDRSNFISPIVHAQKPNVKKVVLEIVNSGSKTLAGFVVDMFCTEMIDVACDFGVPSYMYFTSGATTLGLMFYLQSLRDDDNKDVSELKDSDSELIVPFFANPLPTKVISPRALEKGAVSKWFMDLAIRFRETRGIIINTFMEMDNQAVQSLTVSAQSIPRIYPVGPIMKLDSPKGKDEKSDSIMKWLDEQPECSVVFLCFGSRGCFEEEQVKEIAHALERSGHRFLWSLRKPPPKGQFALPSEYQSPEEVLPEGFLQRTAATGKVIGWVAQVGVLAHPAVGGFVSHCGWNSILESTWYGVPLATWPMYAEQQMNAFQLVKELGLAVEIRLDYRRDLGIEKKTKVSGEEIEKALKLLMDKESEVRRKTKDMQEKSRVTVKDGGSSYNCLGKLIEDVINNISNP